MLSLFSLWDCYRRLKVGTVRRVIADAILTTLGALLLGLFILLWIYGWVTMGEPNLAMRAAETLMCIVIVAFGLSCLWKDYSSIRKK